MEEECEHWTFLQSHVFLFFILDLSKRFESKTSLEANIKKKLKKINNNYNYWNHDNIFIAKRRHEKNRLSNIYLYRSILILKG